MRHTLFWMISVLFGAQILAEEPGTAAKPEEVARRFYSELKRHQVTGLPTGEAWEGIRPLVSEALGTALQRARKEQEEFMRKFPDEKPPWIEGDLFSSLFEGFHGFTVRTPKVEKDRAEIPIEFAYTDRGETTRWTDTLLLRLSESGWRVDDVRYGATWDFANQGTLQAALAPEKPVE